MIGKRIHELRLQKKYSITELAERAGVAKSYISNIERGIMSNPSIQFLEKVAESLGVSMDDLINDPVQQEQDEKLDRQWYELIREAMASGVSKEDFREFLEFNKWKMQNKN
ncbi:helix-turn-helix domain-containing protein [Paenibacillus cremeus]|uniref:Helix-turn-helix domain-containing protein n=1 Tax=Paenibacillus cremeus TaxID=2163881 RepID=A0A559K0N4_9BACL|nr:helix-turn-helix domain-containing protein [Paenibacillus cremeus]TVY05656.1 helix-turn-helix domain-containing protein [Paenibacillus cremeus]